MGVYSIGNGPTLQATFTNPSNVVYDPANVFFTVVVPSGTKTTIQYGQAPPGGWPSIVKASTGVYQLTLPYANVTALGDYVWSADDGNNLVANEGAFSIIGRKATH